MASIRSSGGEPPDRWLDHRAAAGRAPRGRTASMPPGGRAAVVRGVGQDQLVAGPGHRRRRTGGAPPGAGPSLSAIGASPTSSSGIAERLRAGTCVGNRPATRPGMIDDRELEAPWPCGPSARRPRRHPGRGRRSPDRRRPRSASSRWRATNTARSSASSADCDRTMSKNRAMFGGASSARTVARRRAVRERAGPPQERVQDLAGRPLVGELRVAPAGRRRVARRAARVAGAIRRMPGCRSSSSRTSHGIRLRRRARVHDRGQVRPPRLVRLARRRARRRRPTSPRSAIARRNGQQAPDLRPRVQARRIPRTATARRPR